MNITSKPPDPVRVLEGEPLTLEWTFNVTRTILRVELGLPNSLALVEAYLTFNIIRGVFVDRVSVSSTQTNATIILSSMNRTDTATYVFKVLDIGGGSADEPLQIIVQCKYKL